LNAIIHLKILGAVLEKNMIELFLFFLFDIYTEVNHQFCHQILSKNLGHTFNTKTSLKSIFGLEKGYI